MQAQHLGAHRVEPVKARLESVQVPKGSFQCCQQQAELTAECGTRACNAHEPANRQPFSHGSTGLPSSRILTFAPRVAHQLLPASLFLFEPSRGLRPRRAGPSHGAAASARGRRSGAGQRRSREHAGPECMRSAGGAHAPMGRSSRRRTLTLSTCRFGTARRWTREAGLRSQKMAKSSF